MEEIIFPNQIRMFRRVRGITMKSLAKKLDLSLSAVSKIEKGYRRIDERHLKILSNYLNCPPEAIFVSDVSSQPEVIQAWATEQDRRRQMNMGGGLKTLGAGLRYIRGQKKLTLNEVAKRARMTLSVYHRIEMGERHVDEKHFKNIAHALGLSANELQVKIYELDMSGALDNLKHSDRRSGIYISKGGYNDIPISRFMLKEADAQEITIPIYGLPTERGTIRIDRDSPLGSIVCPSTFAKEADLYAVRLSVNTLVSLPRHSVLIVAPQAPIKNGDIALLRVGEHEVKPVTVQMRSDNSYLVSTATDSSGEVLSASQKNLLHRVVLIAMP